jgi:predicted nucleic acid-binding protein
MNVTLSTLSTDEQLVARARKKAEALGKSLNQLIRDYFETGARMGVVSLEVLQEYFVTVTRKLGVDPSIARRKVELLAEFDVVAQEVPDILAAIDLHRFHGFSFWDAMALRAAKQAGCGVLFSEDVQAAREIAGVRILNPFR